MDKEEKKVRGKKKRRGKKTVSHDVEIFISLSKLKKMLHSDNIVSPTLLFHSPLSDHLLPATRARPVVFGEV